MGQARIFGQTAAGGSSSGSTLTVHAEEGSTITVAKDEKSYTSTDNPAVFKRLEDGTWNATAGKEGKNPVSQSIELCTNYVMNLNAKIYGISCDITAPSPHWTRTHDAVGFNATASVGTVAGESDFDTIYPWSEMKRETLSTGDVMVKIPKFYYQRYRDGNIEHINITDRALDGFSLHPLFDRPDGERDYAYVGAYKTSSNNKSVSGAIVQVSQTRATMRDNARKKGVGWSLIDISALSAIQMLFLVEFATNDSQTAIGAGRTKATTATTTGLCDTVPNLTGTTYGNNQEANVVYRGFEDLWGNVWEFVDGVNWVDGSYYVCNDPNNYTDDTSFGYEKLEFTGGTSWNDRFIIEAGFNWEKNRHIMLPATATGGSNSTYQCDTASGASGWRVLEHGGDWSSGNSAGLFCSAMNSASTATSNAVSSRLLYLP